MSYITRKPRRRPNGYGIPQHILWILLGFIIIATVIPITVVITRKKREPPPKSNVLLPLYVYPAPGAWDPLLTAIKTNPQVNFTVVVNPASGPGGSSGPDANYTREIPKLNQHTNVRVVGYVSTNYTNRSLSHALQDIAVYSSWSENTIVSGLGLGGIFLDETPSQYSHASAEFLEALAVATRSETGLGIDPLIIHNPGTLPAAQYLPSANVTVVFEGDYSTYKTREINKAISAFQTSSKCSREALACIIHSLPSAYSDTDKISLARDLRSVAGYIFITGLSVDYYSSFWVGWLGFIANVVT
ncbi:cell surface spherulin 4 family protein [Tricladium varicosporioides]|nr:cell surface spherulin 4 family protein [Hymenoscyphus varicosporioides]